MEVDMELMVFAEKIEEYNHTDVDPTAFICENNKLEVGGACLDGASHRISGPSNPFKGGYATYLCDSCYQEIKNLGLEEIFV